MADKKVKSEKMDGFYKGYDIKWLRKEPHHPDFYLVAEFDALQDKKKK